ncbi:MAG: response regulator, partial [Verrucomicrobiales bacterium]
VVVENDSLKALEVARACRPDIILLDVVMPGLDGGDVEELLRADPDLVDIPLLILTALVSNADSAQDTAAQSGHSAVIAKPVSTEKLVAAIEQRLSP